MLLLAAAAVPAQTVSVGPAVYHRRAKATPRAAAPSRQFKLPPAVEYRLGPLSKEELDKLPNKSEVPLIGVHRRLRGPVPSDTQWHGVPGGRRVWQMAFHSPEARALRVHFTAFDAGGGRVWLHAPSEDSEVTGPYTGRGPYEDGDFWSDIIFADTVVIEYEPAPGRPDAGAPPWVVAELSHVFDTATLPGLTPDKSVRGGPSAAAPCHVDVTCDPTWDETSRAVALIIFEKPQGAATCSGTLLNTITSSNVPYFLTAWHCIDNDTIARSVIALWNYQTPECNGAPPSDLRSLPRSVGARHVISNDHARGDFSLLRFDELPEGAVFSGWTNQELDTGGVGIGIHHPRGEFKRISGGLRDSDVDLPGGRPRDSFYRMRWEVGRTEPGSSGSGLFAAPGVLVGTLSFGPKPPEGATVCDIAPYDFYGRFSEYFPLLRPYLEGRSTPGPANPPAPPPTSSGPVLLTSGEPRPFTLPAVGNPTLFIGNAAFLVNVPEGGGRLEIKVTTEGRADVDLFVRFGEDPAPGEGGIIADFKSTSEGGNESIVITPSTNPALRPGVYHIVLGLFTQGVEASGSIVATVSTGQPQPPGSAQTLTSGQSRPFLIRGVERATLYTGESAYRISVPQGARRLVIKIETVTPGVDVDLFVRYSEAPRIVDGSLVADHASTSETGNETVSITADTSPPLRAGTYYIALGVFTPVVTLNGTIVATIDSGAATEPPSGTTTLRSGQAVRFGLDAVDSPTLFGSPFNYQIEVPEGAARLEVKLITESPDVDVDLYIRRGREPEVADGSVVADFVSESESGNETIAITPASTPALQPGTYYISLVVYTSGRRAAGSITATLQQGATGGGRGTPLLSGAPASFNLPAVERPTFFSGAYRIDVPENANRLEVKLTTDPEQVDVDLLLRFGAEPALTGGGVQTDFSSTGDTGNEMIVLTRPQLRTGAYHIAFAVFTTGAPARATITASLGTGSGPFGDTGGLESEQALPPKHLLRE
ncbi:MAG: PPC domain-containing protein [Acidobacteria bacterium]|nr:PPC domain-containing protein [Acidobacteriota bacterium]